jgi:hypothetical protein
VIVGGAPPEELNRCRFCLRSQDDIDYEERHILVESYGCHQGRHDNTPRPPKTWKPIFYECPRCRGPRTLATAAGIKFFICVPCYEIAESSWKEWY